MMYAANIIEIILLLKDDWAGAHTNGWGCDKGEPHSLPFKIRHDFIKCA